MNIRDFDLKQLSNLKCRICLGLMFSFLGAATQAQRTVINDDGARVLALETLWNQAETARDAAALDHLLAEKFTYVDIDGSIKNKAEFLVSVQNPPEHLQSVGNETMSVQTYDNIVIVNGVYLEKGKKDGKAYSRRGRFTDTWIKQRAGWMCAASQSTVIEK
jgi:ketosteroid isomerase-like protein